MKQYKKIKNVPLEDLVPILKGIIENISPIKNSSYQRNKKYTLEDYIIGIIDVLKSTTSWNNYSGQMNGNTLRKKYNEWVNLGVFDEAYKESLEKYLETKSTTQEFKYQSIDSTFIRDINGCKEARYSGIYKKNKGVADKGFKITSLVTTNGIPISINLKPENKYDSTIFEETLNNKLIDTQTYKYKNLNRYKQYVLADPGYDSKKNTNLALKKGYTLLIKSNRRNTKKPELLKKKQFTKKQEETYKKRIIVENYHSWIKKMPKIKTFNEKKIKNYMGLLKLGLCIIIYRRIISSIT